MLLFGLIMSFCVFIEYKKFNDSITQSIFPCCTWESNRKQKNHNSSSLHAFLCHKVKFNIFIFHYVFMYQAIRLWPCNMLYFNAFNQFCVYTLKCCAFSFYSVYGSTNTMILWGKQSYSWNWVISELSFNSECFKKWSGLCCSVDKNSFLYLDRLTSHLPPFSPQMLSY